MRIPLSIKISTSAIFTAVFIVSVVLFNAYKYLITDQVEEMKQGIHITLSRLQQTIEFLLQKGEVEQVQVELSSLGSIDHMDHAFLVDENSKVTASSRLEYVGKNISGILDEHIGDHSVSMFDVSTKNYHSEMFVADDGTALFAIYPVVLGLKKGEGFAESRVGYLVAHVDLQWMTAQVISVLQLKALPMIFALLMVILLFIVFHNRLLVKRITSINNAAKQFSSSKYKVRADVEGNDELSDLAKSFNEMVDKVERQNDRLIKNEENISLILNYMDSGVITIDQNGIVCSFNKSAEKMFGYASDEIIGETVNLLMPEPYKSKHDDILKNYLATGEKHIIGIGRDVLGLHKDGNIFSMHLSVNELPENDKGEKFFIGSCLDTTVMKQQEQQLRQSQKMDALGKLTGGIAHDYNNMLGVILGYTELLMDKLSGEPKLKKYITEIHQAGQRGAKLTQKLLAFSRKKTAEPHATSINHLLENDRNMLEKALTARIQLIYKLDEKLWPVYLDTSDLEDSILNLCINAMHAINNDGQITLLTENVHLDSKGINELKNEVIPGDYVCLSVCDTGEGIEDDILTRIFDPFFSTKGDKGNGLGLSQVYGFVTRSMGAISVESEPQHGTCFKLYFPRYVGEITFSKATVAKDRGKYKGKETILIVDDEPSLRVLLNEILTSNGYTVIQVESGMQAIEILKTKSVDMLISDVIMPGMNGYQLAEYVHQHYPQIKVQLASGYSDNSHKAEQIELHNNILKKPFELDRLLAIVRETLNDKNEGDELVGVDWFDSVLTDVASIDEDHLQMIKMTAKCSKLVTAGNDAEQLDSMIDELLEFSQNHFKREQFLINACMPVKLKQCKSTHDFLIKTLRKKYTQFKNDLIDAQAFMRFLNDWLRDHMVDLDRNLLLPLVETKRDEIEAALSKFEEIAVVEDVHKS